MSNGEKDKLGEKLHDVEAARENEWARKHDQELLEKLREAQHGDVAKRAGQAQAPICPECKQELVPNTNQRIGGMICPQRHGAWFGWDTVAQIMGDFAHTKK